MGQLRQGPFSLFELLLSQDHCVLLCIGITFDIRMSQLVELLLPLH